MGQGEAGLSYAACRCRTACALLPPHLRRGVLALSEEELAATEELRLRTGCPLCRSTAAGEQEVPGPAVSAEDLEQVVDAVTGYSRYTASETMRQGYLTAQGGFRVGLCGSAVVERGEVGTFQSLSSLAIRIPREQPGIALPLLPQLLDAEGGLRSTLLIGAPGGGKTTLLRDLVRGLSDRLGLRVALVDERGEIAALHRGRPQLQVGRHTDVMDACPKALAVPALLRAMAPQVIALDELALAADVEAVTLAAHAGTALLATVHGRSVEELRRKPLFAALLETGVFALAVCISVEEGRRRYRVEELREAGE